MSKLKLLYVEDDRNFADFFIEDFTRKGCEVHWRLTSSSAVKQMDRENFDLVITDYNLMYGDTGIPVAEEALKRGIPVRVFSGASWEDDRIESVRGIWVRKHYPEEIFDFIQEVQESKAAEKK